MYEYLDRKPEAGDIVEALHDSANYTKGKLYIAKGIHPNSNQSIAVELDDSGSTTNGWHYSNFKVVKTLPGDQAKVGDTCIRVGESLEDSPKGATFIVTHIYDGKIGYKKHHLTYPVNIRVLCLAETKPKAYYKRSGLPWTVEELQQIPHYWYNADLNRNLPLKWVYPTSTKGVECFVWGNQRPEKCPERYNIVAFEDEFPDIETLPITIPIGSYWQEMYTSTSIGQIVEVVKLGINSVHFEYIETGERKNRSTSEFLNYFIPVQKLPISPSELGAQAEPTKPIIKEQSMNFQQLINSIFQDKIQTDYDKKPDYLVVIYNNEGTEIAQATADSIATVEAKIQSTPKLWGCKAVCYKIDTEVQTKVPVTSTKIKKSK